MKARFEIEFGDEAQARLAAKALAGLEAQNQNVAVHVTHGFAPASKKQKTPKLPPNTIIYDIRTTTFAGLRARATSLLRDLKVCRDAFELSKRVK